MNDKRSLINPPATLDAQLSSSLSFCAAGENQRNGFPLTRGVGGFAVHPRSETKAVQTRPSNIVWLLRLELNWMVSGLRRPSRRCWGFVLLPRRVAIFSLPGNKT